MVNKHNRRTFIKTTAITAAVSTLPPGTPQVAAAVAAPAAVAPAAAIPAAAMVVAPAVNFTLKKLRDEGWELELGSEHDVAYQAQQFFSPAMKKQPDANLTPENFFEGTVKRVLSVACTKLEAYAKQRETLKTLSEREIAMLDSISDQVDILMKSRTSDEDGKVDKGLIELGKRYGLSDINNIQGWSWPKSIYFGGSRTQPDDNLTITIPEKAGPEEVRVCFDRIAEQFPQILSDTFTRLEDCYGSLPQYQAIMQALPDFVARRLPSMAEEIRAQIMPPRPKNPEPKKEEEGEHRQRVREQQLARQLARESSCPDLI